ncbi:CHAT domain-containing tetratricopeptide repeat protein [Aliterella atlantica]|uniref:CHAT domain-containing tetratricopeptide repeat protein n=1 Tax=Aliterella atlantica TaxID=1827278 RepID=UPI00069885C8|nr:CHAT domain-containing protein [Aliterella atlantica]
MTLPNFARRALAATFGILLLSESLVVANPKNAKPLLLSPIAQSNNSTAYKQGQQLIAEGKQLWQQGTPLSKQQAIAKYEAALKIWQQIKERSQEIKTLNGIAIFYYLQGNEQKAAEYFTKVDAINPGVSKKGQQLLGEGKQLTQQGTLEARRQALVKYQESLKIWQETGQSVFEALTLSSIGNVYSAGLKDYPKALTYYNQASTIWRELREVRQQASTLSAIAITYNNLGETQKEIATLNQALALLQTEKTKKLPQAKYLEISKLEAGILQNIAPSYFTLGETQKAFDALNRALSIQKANNDLSAQASTLQVIGTFYGQSGNPQKALEYLDRAVAIYKKTGDLSSQSLVLNLIGIFYFQAGETQKALETQNQVLSVLQAEQSKPGIAASDNLLAQASTLNAIAGLNTKLGNFSQALNFYDRARVLLQQVRNPQNTATGLLDNAQQTLKSKQALYKESIILAGIGDTYQLLGENQKALNSFNQALEFSRQAKQPSQEAYTLNKIAEIYNLTGEPQQALDALNRAIAIARAAKQPDTEAQTLAYIANIYSSLGDYQLSIETYNQTLALFQKIGDRASVAQTLSDLGDVYQLTGNYTQALNSFNQAQLLWKQQKNSWQEAFALSKIVGVYTSLRDYPQAIATGDRALSLSRQLSKLRTAKALNSLGNIYLAAGDRQKALNFSNQALSLAQEVGNPAESANALRNIGKSYDLRQSQKAVAAYNQELALWQKLGDRLNQAETLYNIAQTQRNSGNLIAAQAPIQNAIALVEGIRTKVTSADLRTSFFATDSVQNYYEFYIDLLMQLHQKQPSKGYDAMALQISERDRARALVELLSEANADIRQGVEPKLLEQESSIQQKLNALEKRRLELVNDRYSEQQLVNLEKENSALLAQYQTIQAQIRANSPRYAALTQPQPLTSAKIQQLLDDRTLLLEYSLGKERSYLWVVSKTGIKSYQLPKQEEIEATTKRFYNTITDPKFRNNPQRVANVGTALSKILLAPAAAQLGQKRLVIVADGALQYLPFAALPIPTEASNPSPLIAKHEIISLPSASTLAVLRQELKGRKKAIKNVAILADPVFSPNDDRIQRSTKQQNNSANIEQRALVRAATRSGVNFARLLGTRTEAEEILQLVRAGDRLQKFDFDANREAVTSPQLSQYRIVHFATHGILNSVNPELSGIVLSLVDRQGAAQNGFLRLHEIFNLNLPAELVVISACQTGLGEEVKGEGIVGLTRGFMYAGSPRVVVSLWNVDDRATAELMARFYKGILKKGLQPAAALRAAQLEMLQTQWKSPYYWSAFGLQGEWK